MLQKILLCLFSFVHVVDGLLTYWGITRGGINEDSNSVVIIFFINHFGPGLGLAFSKAIAIFFGGVLYRLHKEYPIKIFRWGIVLVLVYATYLTGKDSLEWAYYLFWK